MTTWLIDSGDWTDHGEITEKVFRLVSPKSNLHRIRLPQELYIKDILKSLDYIEKFGKSGDIILVTWIISKNKEVDKKIKSMCRHYRFICSAGNLKQNVNDFTPANLQESIEVIHAIKKNGELASFSNFGDNTIEMYGTNIDIEGKKYSGTTIAAALYAGLVSRNSNPVFMKKAKKMLRIKFLKELYG